LAIVAFARFPLITTVTAFGSNFPSFVTERMSAYLASTLSRAA
jgi:hypothetical protein